MALGSVVLVLAACDSGAPEAPAPKAEIEDAAAAGFLQPPTVTAATPGPGGVMLSGQGQSDATIRMATPGGAALTAVADKTGAWRLTVPTTEGLRLYGLSMASGARTVQAEGYLAVTPQGEAALLRSGAGARAVTSAAASPRILAVDFDSEGGAALSGVGPAGESLRVTADGGPQGEGRVGADGAFTIALTEPLAAGARRLALDGPGGGDARTVEVGPAAPITTPPFVAARLADGWRIDWMTPGGGVQTTLLFDHAAGS